MTTVDGADAMVATALDAFGGIDIVVNNAGITYNTPFDELDPKDVQAIVDVNVMGPMWVSRAAWPHMKAKGYGRIVNITSSSLFGAALQVAYCTSKGGVFSLTRALAAEGERFGILVNSVAPAGFTNMVIGGQEEDCPTYQGTKKYMPPEAVSPAVAWLAHERCTTTGECIEAMGGSMKRIYTARTPGFADPALTLETVAERWDDVLAGASDDLVPHAFMDGYMRHDRPYTSRHAKAAE